MNDKPYMINKSLGMSRAIELLNSIQQSFLIAVDDNGKAVGTLTDGDVRRGLIFGKSLDDSVESFCNTKFTYGNHGEYTANISKLQGMLETNSFLPILNKDGKIVDVLEQRSEKFKIRSALIMAGGYGRRLGNLTECTPKPLVNVNGKPMIEHVLGNIEKAGINKVFISTHYLAEQISDYFSSRENKLEIELLGEDIPLGTAGALSLLPTDARNNHVLVTNCDVITDLDFTLMISSFSNSHPDVLMAVAKHQFEIPFGVVRFLKDQEFGGILEKPSAFSYVAGGVNILAPGVVDLVCDREKIDMPDLINRAQKCGMRINVYPLYESWVDLGQKEQLFKFEDSAQNV